MTLKEQINEDLKKSIKAKDELRTSTLRMLKSEIMKLEVSGTKKEATNDDVLGIIQKLVKQRYDSAQQYETGNRPELAEKEKKEAKILEEYLPRQLSRDEVRDIVKSTIAEIDARDMNDVGRVMKAVMPKVKGMADGKTVNEIVQELLP
jgi:hypothetical protein